MKLSVFILSLVCSLVWTNRTYAAETGNPKVLVVYYSKSGNTKAIAEMIQAKTHGDIYEIETVNSYPRERPAAAEIPKQERETGQLPALKGQLPVVSQYDIIFVGSPIWWYTAATPVMSYLRDTDFQGKVVAGFYTVAGNAKDFDKDFHALVKNAKIGRSIGFHGTYDTGRGEQPNGWAYQQEQKKQIEKDLDIWLNKVFSLL